jgi:transposase
MENLDKYLKVFKSRIKKANKQILYAKNIYFKLNDFILPSLINGICKKSLFVSNYNKLLNKYFKDVETNVDFPTSFRLLDYIKDQKCIPFWNDNLTNVSASLFMPSIDNLIKINSTFNNTNRWFNNEFYTEKQHIPNLNKIEIEPPNNISSINKCRKIIFIPNEQQKLILNKFASIYRYFYNRVICFFNNIKDGNSYYTIDPNTTDEKNKIIVTIDNSYSNLPFIRKKLKHNYPEWINKLNAPSHLIDKAFSEAIKAYTNNMEKYKITKKPFKLKYKSKKDIVQTINIEKCYLSKKYNTFFPKYKYNDSYIFRNIRLNENISKYDLCDSSISFNRILNKYTLNLSYNDKTIINEKNKVCSLDPGIRNFMTLYCDHYVAKIGINCKEHLNKLYNEINIIRSRMNNKSYFENNKEYIVNSKRKKQLRKALLRKYNKINNLIQELHSQTINYLTSNFSKVILPPFQTQQMVKKINENTNKERKISKNNANMMNTLSFYKFRERLITKGIEKNCIIEVKPEYYTSITCTKCGNIKKDLDCNKMYNCNNCGLTLERDYNGTRNIMLRNHY